MALNSQKARLISSIALYDSLTTKREIYRDSGDERVLLEPKEEARNKLNFFSVLIKAK